MTVRWREGMARTARAAAVAAIACVACSRAPDPDAVDRAEFGIFFGGQVQEREEIPFELDRTKQVQGFRVDFAKPLPRDTAVEWELRMPRVSRRARGATRVAGQPDGGGDRSVVAGKETVRAGERRLEHVLQFKPGDPLGLWNIRVVVANHVLLDRPFVVHDPDERARAVDGGSPK